MKYLFLLLAILPVNLFFAQGKSTDSLKKFNYSELKEKFDDYYNNDKSLEAKTLQNIIFKSKRRKNTLQIAEGYILNHFNEDFPTALKYILIALILLPKT